MLHSNNNMLLTGYTLLSTLGCFIFVFVLSADESILHLKALAQVLHAPIQFIGPP
jgi:hypothetical protein